SRGDFLSRQRPAQQQAADVGDEPRGAVVVVGSRVVRLARNEIGAAFGCQRLLGEATRDGLVLLEAGGGDTDERRPDRELAGAPVVRLDAPGNGKTIAEYVGDAGPVLRAGQTAHRHRSRFERRDDRRPARSRSVAGAAEKCGYRNCPEHTCDRRLHHCTTKAGIASKRYATEMEEQLAVAAS